MRTDVNCRHVVSNAVCIDLNILIPFIEDVGSQLILNHFRHYMGGRYNGLTLPRSWIVRAFFRGASERPNGSMPYVLVPALQTLLEILLGRIPSSRCLSLRGWICELTKGYRTTDHSPEVARDDPRFGSTGLSSEGVSRTSPL